MSLDRFEVCRKPKSTPWNLVKLAGKLMARLIEESSSELEVVIIIRHAESEENEVRCFPAG